MQHRGDDDQHLVTCIRVSIRVKMTTRPETLRERQRRTKGISRDDDVPDEKKYLSYERNVINYRSSCPMDLEGFMHTCQPVQKMMDQKGQECLTQLGLLMEMSLISLPCR